MAAFLAFNVLLSIFSGVALGGGWLGGSWLGGGWLGGGWLGGSWTDDGAGT